MNSFVMIHFGSCELGEEEETKKVTWKVLCCGNCFEFMCLRMGRP